MKLLINLVISPVPIQVKELGSNNKMVHTEIKKQVIGLRLVFMVQNQWMNMFQYQLNYLKKDRQ